MNTLVLLIAVLPGALLCYFIFRVDKYEREGVWSLLLAFALGTLVTFPAVSFEQWAFDRNNASNPDFLDTIILAFGAIAANEELLKFAALMLGAYPFRFFNEPLDGIVYSVMVSMGFATVENLVYADRFGFQTVILRSFTAVPAHFVFAIVMGFYVGRAKFRTHQTVQLLFKGLLLSIALHGVYDFFIIQNWSEWLVVLGTIFLYLSLYYSRRFIKEHLNNSPFRGHH